MREIACFEDLVVNRRIILKLILKEIGHEGVDWINVAQDRGQWRAFVNITTKLRVLGVS